MLDCVTGSEGDDGRRADKTPSAGGGRAEEAEEEAECHGAPQVSATYVCTESVLKDPHKLTAGWTPRWKLWL